VANRNHYIETLKEDYSSLLAVPAISNAQGNLDDERLEVLASTHLLRYFVRFFAGKANFTIAGEKFSIYLISKPNFAQIDSSVLRNALLTRDGVNLRRRLFTTSKGHVGMALQNVLPSDLICILFGCSMPMVLRKIENGYRLIGECYVHGLVDVEALDFLQRREVASELRNQVVKLRIVVIDLFLIPFFYNCSFKPRT
jgi:hypothetical protein